MHKSSLFFITFAASLLGGLPSEVSAQTVVLSEDFDGLSAPHTPPGWHRLAMIPMDWTTGSAITNGCMPTMPPGMGITGNQLLGNTEYWNPGVCGIDGETRLLTAAIAIQPGMNYRVTFDYYLDVDVAGGDEATVRFHSWLINAPSSTAVASSQSGLVQGAWTHFDAVMTASSLAQYAASTVQPGLEFKVKTAAPSGRAGWALDNLLVIEQPSLSYTSGCGQNGPHDTNSDGVPDVWCPCINYGAVGAGCANSAFSGATISLAGSDLFSVDDLTLSLSGIPSNKFAMLVSGNAAPTPWVSGTGVSCIIGPFFGHGVRSGDALGNATWGGPGFLSSNGWVAGTQLNLMVQYRDRANFWCNNATFNWSNSISMTVMP